MCSRNCIIKNVKDRCFFSLPSPSRAKQSLIPSLQRPSTCRSLSCHTSENCAEFAIYSQTRLIWSNQEVLSACQEVSQGLVMLLILFSSWRCVIIPFAVTFKLSKLFAANKENCVKNYNWSHLHMHVVCQFKLPSFIFWKEGDCYIC